MTEGVVCHNIYTYTRHCQNGHSQAVDIHDIFIKRSKVRVFLSYLGTLLLLASIYHSFVVKEQLCVSSIWCISLGVLLFRFLRHKPVKKESVVIMPAFGLQLETHFWSGRVERRFVPIGKILRPILSECVTPVTCYWSLVLILRDEEELMLVFQKLRPPVKMLVPVWKALRAATNSQHLSNTSIDPQAALLHANGE